MELLVKLAHAANPDIRGGYWSDPVDDGRAVWVPVASIDEASATCRAYIDRNGLGAGNWTGGYVSGPTPPVRVAYNGRVLPVEVIDRFKRSTR